jgi:uncharacterized membrane protein
MTETTIPPVVFTLWRVTLVAAYVLFVPTAVYWLRTLWRAASSIRTYARECAEAAEAIAQNTTALPALDLTIAVATEMLAAAEAVAGKLDAAAAALEARAGRS